MKFDKEGKKIINQAKVFLDYLNSTTKSFRHFCEDIVKDNQFTNEGYVFKKIDNKLNTIKAFNDEISDNILIMERNIIDKERASVLFPYEKQAIYQYLSKFDFKKHCRKKCGCIYAEKILKDDKEIVTIGFSICNDKDEFSKNIALNLAKKRAREYPTRYDIRVTPRPDKFPMNSTFSIPYKWMYEGEIVKFVKRCTRWFKNETIIYPNNIDFVEFPKKKKKDKHEPTGEKKEMPF